MPRDAVSRTANVERNGGRSTFERPEQYGIEWLKGGPSRGLHDADRRQASLEKSSSMAADRKEAGEKYRKR